MCNLPSEEKHSFYDWIRLVKEGKIPKPLTTEYYYASQKQRHAELLRENQLYTKEEIKGTTIHTIDIDVLNKFEKPFECLMCKEKDVKKRSPVAGGLVCNHCQSKLDLEDFFQR